jgi:flagellar basal-body rod modification protein FlgD
VAVQPVASSPTAATSPAATAGALAGNGASLGQADFVKLLTTQMQYQDPMNPISNTDFVAQLAQFSSLQGMQQLNSSINQMLLLQQLTQGSALIGKQITFTSSGKALATNGVVSSVQVNNGSVQLMVGTQAVSLNQVTSVAPAK